MTGRHLNRLTSIPINGANRQIRTVVSGLEDQSTNRCAIFACVWVGVSPTLDLRFRVLLQLTLKVIRPRVLHLKAGAPYGAKDEIRTRDPYLGKVMLYQLSYFRNM